MSTTCNPLGAWDTPTGTILTTHGHPLPMEDVLGRLIHRFAIRHRQIGHDFPLLLSAIRERCVLTDKPVSLQTASGPLTGTVQGIADDGALLLHDGQQLHRLLQADEVRLNFPASYANEDAC